MTDLCCSILDGGGGRTRTYEGVSQRIYSPPPLPLGTLPRRRTSHPRGRAFPLAGRVYGEPPRGVNHGKTAPAGPSLRPRPRRFLRLKRRDRGVPRRTPTGLILRRRHGSVASTAGPPCANAAHARPPPIRRAPVRRTRPAGTRKPERSRSPRGAEARAGDGAVILYGWHTVKAALENPARRIRKLFATENAARRLAEDGLTPAVETEIVRPDAIAKRLGRTPCTTDCWPKPIPCPRPSSTSSSPPASCWCSTRSPTRTMSARSCAPPRASRWRRWSPPRGTARKRPACWRNPPPARSNMCRSSRCRISPVRSRRCASADICSSASTAAETSTSARRRCARRSRWCWARKARDCGN